MPPVIAGRPLPTGDLAATKETRREVTLEIGLSLAPTWLRGNAWRRPESKVEEMFSLATYAEIAQAADRSGVDVLFVPDAGYLRGSVATSPGFSTLDSHTLVSALVPLTERVRLVPTVQTMFASPYATARQLQSLHQLSNGRAGWNAVTALGGHENFGLSALPDSAQRYAKAAEFVEVVQRLWESYPANAIIADRAAGTFADDREVTPIEVSGEYFRVRGPLATPAHDSARPQLFQAGGSPAGVEFAAAKADAVFASAPSLASALEQRAALQAAAVRAGRAPEAVKFCPGLSVVLASSAAEAEEIARSGLAEDQTTSGSAPAGAMHWTVVGTPDQMVAEVRRWDAEGAIDGCIVLPGGSPTSMQLFFSEVMPALRD